MAVVLSRKPGGAGGGGAPSGPAGGDLAGTYPNPTIANNASELDYAQITASVTVSATVESAPNDVIAVPARVYDGATIVIIEFYCSSVSTGAVNNAFTILNLWDGATDLGRIGDVKASANSPNEVPVLLRRRLTPSAASHTFSVKAWRVSANGAVSAGAGGAGIVMPTYLRVTRV